MPGQVSAEAMASVAALLIVLLILYSQLSSRNAQIDSLGSSLQHRSDCTQLEDAIALAQESGANSRIEISMRSDANLSSGSLFFGGGYSCYIARSGTLAAQLHGGNVRVSYVGGVVSVENF